MQIAGQDGAVKRLGHQNGLDALGRLGQACSMTRRMFLLRLAAALAVTGGVSGLAAGAGPDSGQSPGSSGEEGAARQSRCEIVNRTGQDLYALFLAPGGLGKNGHWSVDLLQGSPLRQGASVKLVLPYRGIWWDLRVENDAGESLEWTTLPLRRSRGVILTFSAGRPGAETY